MHNLQCDINIYVGYIFIISVTGYEPPLNAVMMLWVNLIMDTMGALALGRFHCLLIFLDNFVLDHYLTCDPHSDYRY